MLTIPRKKPGKLDDVRSNGWLDAMKSSSPPSKKILKNCNVEVALDDSDVAYCSWMLSYPSALNSFEKIINRARNKKMIVNGPEVLSKFVGETEKNVRDLFADVEQDQRTQGDQSDLHVIIFDEIDAICKSRGSTRDGTGVYDSIVNQLLTKIDGVESLNNVLLIGMTNRKDLLDEALLRPGRLKVQVEISLPDEHGRLQILQIHTNNMKENCTRILDSMSIFGRIKYFWMDVYG